MASEAGAGFQEYFWNRNGISAAITENRGKVNSHSNQPPGAQIPLRKLWETSDLSAHEFADEVARFYGLTRLTLPQLFAASPVTKGFSQRFLRESSIFPFEGEEGRFKLAVADPGDVAAVARRRDRARRARSQIEVASFEDIATVLAERLGGEEADGPEAGAARHRQATTTSRACAISRAARRSCAPSTTCSRGRWSCARATSISSRSATGLVVRMRVDGLLARGAGAGRRAAAGADLAHQDSRRPQHRRAAAAAGRRGAPARRAHRDRHPRRHHADAARRIRRDPPAAARSRPARHRQARPRRWRPTRRSPGCSRCRTG